MLPSPTESSDTGSRFMRLAVFVLAISGLALIQPDITIPLGPACMVVAITILGLYGGLALGLIGVIIASLLVDFLWVQPRYTLVIDAAELPWFTTFVVLAILGATIFSLRRQTELRLKQAHDQMEAQVNERTHALETIIAERQKTEDSARRLRDELARITRLTTMGEMTAGVAHEINQPLAAISANANACLRWMDSTPANWDEARSAVERIVRDGNRAADVVKSVRAMTSRTPRNVKALDINAIVVECLDLIGHDLKRRQIKIEQYLSRSLPAVLADQVQLQQIILNLALNAMDAMEGTPPGDRFLTIKTTRRQSGQILIEVQDSGEGISPDHLPRIFDAFFSTRPYGMGMGLAVTRTLIESFGGNLWVETNPDVGSHFLFTLPTTEDARPSCRPHP